METSPVKPYEARQGWASIEEDFEGIIDVLRASMNEASILTARIISSMIGFKPWESLEMPNGQTYL